MQSLETLPALSQPIVTPAEVDEELRVSLRASHSWVSILTRLGYWHRVTSNGRVDTLCPFHAEKTPSLRMWPSGFFYCHGCQARGDVLDFIFWLKEEDYQPLRFFLLSSDPNQGLLFQTAAHGSST